jgi:hypothetical protein
MMGDIVPHPVLLRCEAEAMEDIKKLIDANAGKLSVIQMIGIFEVAKLYVLEQQYEEDDGK